MSDLRQCLASPVYTDIASSSFPGTGQKLRHEPDLSEKSPNKVEWDIQGRRVTSNDQKTNVTASDSD